MSELADNPFKRKLDFSKDHMRRRRHDVAVEISSLRRRYFERQKELNGRLESLPAKHKVERQILLKRISECVAALRESEAALEQLKDVTVYGIVDTLKRRVAALISWKERSRQVREEMGVGLKLWEYNEKSKGLSAEKAALEEELRILDERFDALLRELSEDRDDRRELEEARAKLKAFHELESKEWLSYHETRKERQLENVIRKKQVFFPHGTVDGWAPTGNTPVRTGVDALTKMKMVLALEPSIPVYHLRPGKSVQLWAPQGVLLKAGEIVSIGEGTHAYGLKRRRHGRDMSFKSYAETLDRITDIRIQGGTEMAIDEPRVAGLYVSDICLAKDPYHVEGLRRFADGLGLPVFLIDQNSGNVFELTRNSDGRYGPGKQVSPESVLDSDFEITEEQRASLLEDIREARPFVEGVTEESLAKGDMGYGFGEEGVTGK